MAYNYKAAREWDEADRQDRLSGYGPMKMSTYWKSEDDPGIPRQYTQIPQAAPQEKAEDGGGSWIDFGVEFAKNLVDVQRTNSMYAKALEHPSGEPWKQDPEPEGPPDNRPLTQQAADTLIDATSNSVALKHSALYESFFLSEEQKNAEVARIANILKIDENVFKNDQEMYRRAAEAADRVEKLAKNKEFLDENGNVDMNKIYAAMPGLEQVQREKGAAAAALALGQMKGFKAINDVYGNEFTRFFGSAYTGMLRGRYTQLKNDIYAKAMLGRRRLTAQEEQEVNFYEKQLEDLSVYSYSGTGAVLGSAIGGAAENAPMIGRSSATGMAAGAVAGGAALWVTKSPQAAWKVFRTANAVGMGAEMALEIGGGQYEENINKLDEEGRYMYTPTQAAVLSGAQGVAESALELYSLRTMGRAILGKGTALKISEIVRSNSSMEAAKKGIRAVVRQDLKEGLKAGAISFGAEAAEEFEQEAADMVLENLMQMYAKGEKADVSSIGEILIQSTGAMIDAGPALFGFGMVGAGGHAVTHTRGILNARANIARIQQDKIYAGRMANQYYGSVVNGVRQNVDKIQELQNKAPEVVTTILDENNRLAGMENGFVDAKAMMETEQGKAHLEQLMKENKIGEDELEAALRGTGMLEVKTSSLQQLAWAEEKAADENGTVVKDRLADFITLSPDIPTEQQVGNVIKVAQEQMAALEKQEQEQKAKVINNIIETHFKNEKEAATAREILEANPDDPAKEYRRRYRAVMDEIMSNEEIVNALDNMRRGMKQGTIFLYDPTGYEKVGRGTLNDEWYSNWYKEYKAPPNKEQQLYLAYDNLTGRHEAQYTIEGGMDPRADYAQPEFERMQAILDPLFEEKERLDDIKDKIKTIKPGDLMASATLSPEGLKVYEAAKKVLSGSDTPKVRKAAEANALLLARYANRMAGVISKVENRPFTAEDYIRERLVIRPDASMEETLNQGGGIRQLLQEAWHGSPYDFDSFDLGAIGTGEGAQVHGWGLYFAKDKKVAEGYQDKLVKKLSVRKYTVDGRVYSAKDNDGIHFQEEATGAAVEDEQLARALMTLDRFSGDRKIALKSLEVAAAYAKMDGREAALNQINAEIDYLQNKRIDVEYIGGKGILMKVDVPEDDVLLDESKSYDEQPEKVKEALERIPADLSPELGIGTVRESGLEIYNAIGTNAFQFMQNGIEYISTQDGSVMYKVENNRITKELTQEEIDKVAEEWGIQEIENPNRQRTASLILNHYGVKGIAYEGGTDGPCVVVFDDAATKIIDKYNREAKSQKEAWEDAGKEPLEQLLQRAYHGSPYDFDKFDLGKIGSGEGAQAHGWGLYFAADEKIARGYWEKLVQWKEKDEKAGALFKVDVPENDVLLDEQKRFGAQDKNVKKLLLDAIRDLTPKQSEKFWRSVLPSYYWEQTPAGEAAQEKAWQKVHDVDDVLDALAVIEPNGINFSMASAGFSMVTKPPLTQDQAATKLADYYSPEEIERLKVDTKYRANETGKWDAERQKRTAETTKAELEHKQLSKEVQQKMVENPGELLEKVGADGEALYTAFVMAWMEEDGDSWKNASLYLNDHGIKGVSYEGGKDGRCFVVFDDKAIDVIQRYNQAMAGKQAKGAFSRVFDSNKKIISLFANADQSTFVHEMAHLYLTDLQELAKEGAGGQVVEDLKTVMDWATYDPKQAKEYAGTASGAEFIARDEAIKAAEKAMDHVRVKALKDEWAQERFARAFEEYLRAGEAPAEGLKKVFRRFKRWLCDIYKTVTGAGVRATPEVEAVMARMIATDEEIEAISAANSVARLQKLDPDILESDVGKMYERWKEEAKEQAKEKLLRKILRRYNEQIGEAVDRHMEAYKAEQEKEMQNTAAFVVEQFIKEGLSVEDAINIGQYESVEEYRADLQAQGWGYDQELRRRLQREKKRFIEEKKYPNQQELTRMAEEEALASINEEKLAALEAAILEAKQRRYEKMPDKVAKALGAVEKTRKTAEVEKLQHRVKELKYELRWNAAQWKLITDIEVGMAKAEGKRKLEVFDQKFRALKDEVRQNKAWLRGVRDAALGMVTKIREQARADIRQQPLSAATNPRAWHRRELEFGKSAWKNAAKGTAESIAQAKQDKQVQTYFAALTGEAVKARVRAERMLRNMRKRSKQLNGKKRKMDANVRYYHEHIMYVIGLRSKDAQMPYKMKAFDDMMNDLQQSLVYEGTIPDWIAALATLDQPSEKNYRRLSLEQFEELHDFLKMLYTAGENDGRLISLNMKKEDALNEIMTDIDNTTGLEEQHHRIDDITGALGNYMAEVVKPEVILSTMAGKDGSLIKYVYRTIMEATEAEEKAQEAEAVWVKEHYTTYYTPKELAQIANDKIELTDAAGVPMKLRNIDKVTKETILCMALNRGNELNIARLCASLGLRIEEIDRIFDQHMTKKDWMFVQDFWDHIGSFADPVSEVLEKTTGVPMKREEAQSFKVNIDGDEMVMRGGYYPIVRDPGLSVRAATFEQLQQGRALGGATSLGVGLGATKERSQKKDLADPLLLELQVAHRHIAGQMHIIYSRIPVLDAFKIINSEEMKQATVAIFGDRYGTQVYKNLRNWVTDCWHVENPPTMSMLRAMGFVRSKTVAAIMGYRVSTALLNFANVFYMMNEIGPVNSIAAVLDFYRSPVKNKDFILNESIFMRNRAMNMDRDLNRQTEEMLHHNPLRGSKMTWLDKASYMVDKHANTLIEVTDMVFSLPLYHWQFKKTYNEQLMKGVSEEEARKTANFDATRAVTHVFPSSRTVDTSAMLRSRNEGVKLFTPFYSFCATQMNAVWTKYYEGKYQNTFIETKDKDGNVVREKVKRSFIQKYGRAMMSAFYLYLLGTFFETAIRQISFAATDDGDDDFWDKLTEDFGTEYASNIVSAALGGFPIINVMAEGASSHLIEHKSIGRSPGGVFIGALGRADDVWKNLDRWWNDKSDFLDLMRAVAKASNSFTGFSDTLTDAVFNSARFIEDDAYSIDDPDALREYLAKSVFDRKLKKKSR